MLFIIHVSVCFLACIFKIVQLEFQDFDIESYGRNRCPYDHLTVYDGPDTSSPLLAKLCGNNEIRDIISSGRSLFFKFTSDHMIERTGFRINVSFVMG